MTTAPAAPTSGRQTLEQRLSEWAERATADHQAAVAAAAALSARVGSGPVAAAEEFERLGIVQAMQAVERAARQVYGEPPAEWRRYYPSPAAPIRGMHATEISLAAGSVIRPPADPGDPIADAITARERHVPRLTLRVIFDYGEGAIRVGHVSRLAQEWTREEFEDTLLDQLHAAIDEEEE